MEKLLSTVILLLLSVMQTCVSYNILAIFPYNGRSHHIYFSTLVEELATRNHSVTVINYFPVKKMPNLKQISLLEHQNEGTDFVDMKDQIHSFTGSIFGDFLKAYDSAYAFKAIASRNCKKLVSNKEIKDIVGSNTKYDLVIVEQFATDCHLALAHKFGAPMIGMTAHVLMPWTYSRLGAINNPTFVPNHFFGSGSKPNFWTRIKSLAINTYLETFYRFVIQKNDYEILKDAYPGTPDLEILGKQISLVLLNQYFPLTGSQLYGRNVIEVGGLHIKETSQLNDKELQSFLENSTNGVVYISFGTVAKNFPKRVLREIIKMIEKSDMDFVWKVDDINMDVPRNVLLKNWVSQPAILCTGVMKVSFNCQGNAKLKAFITHSGMLSSAEAMHCGVPTVCVPLFGDQFANAASAEEAGLGVKVDIFGLDEKLLREALDTVLQDKYQARAKQLSLQWKDRTLSPLDTAIYWIEYVVKHPQINLQPPTVNLPIYQYFMLDAIGAILGFIVIVAYLLKITFRFVFGNKIVAKSHKRGVNKKSD